MPICDLPPDQNDRTAVPQPRHEEHKPPFGGPVGRPTFAECLVCAANTPELVSEFDRLTEHNLSRIGSGLDLAIDDASGRTEQGMRDFIAFVRDCIYRTLVD